MFKKWFKSAMALVLCAVVTASTGVSGISEMENVQVESEESGITPCFDIDLPIIKE